jgi:glycosyltransferase involved in cell wall biosynthesis
MHICTIVARNYIAYARVLGLSFRKHHRDGHFSVLVIDDLEEALDDSSEPFELIRASEIGLSRLEYHRMAMIYTTVELATAVKPWLLRALLARGSSHVVYLDPDIQVFGSLSQIGKLADKHSIVLIPHMTEPMPPDHLKPTELDILQAGAYNLGFIAVGIGSEPFLNWWSDRLRTHSIKAPERGLMVDQRWVDLVPGYFGAHVLRDPAYNVAYWNLATRHFERNGQKYMVSGRPLRFFHFSGFNPSLPDLLSKFQIGEPRVDLRRHPALAEVCREYAELLFQNGFPETNTVPYAFDFLSDGSPITHRMRRRYRMGVLAVMRSGGLFPPDPFDLASNSEFWRWYKAFNRFRPAAQRLTSAVLARGALLSDDYPALYALGRQVLHATRRARQSLEVRTKRNGSKRPPPLVKPGINVAGYFRTESGVGEAGRLLLAAVHESGLPFNTVLYAKTPNRQEHPFGQEGSAWPCFDTNIICVNADALHTFATDVGAEFFKQRRNVGFWMWEVENFPRRMRSAFRHVDEVWVPSHHVARAISPATRKPVHVFPLPVVAPEAIEKPVRIPGGNNRFMFLFMFDFLSIFERKNPTGLVQAYKKAFGPSDGAVLVIKSISGDQRREQLQELQASANGRDDIKIIDGYMAAPQRDGLFAACDCYVSLHRSEGFGLTLSEAMAMGKPVIATGYSGNLEFMNEQNSYLVPYEMTTIPPGSGPYPPGGRWADPDLGEAALLMRHVFEHRDEARRTGRRARREILSARAPAAGAEFIRARLLSRA